MPSWTSVDLVAAAALAVALFGALLLGAIISRAREEILGSPVGWRLVAASLSLFALRGLAYFLPVGMTDGIEHLAGILPAIVLPVGLFLVLRSSLSEEGTPRG